MADLDGDKNSEDSDDQELPEKTERGVISEGGQTDLTEVQDKRFLNARNLEPRRRNIKEK